MISVYIVCVDGDCINTIHLTDLTVYICYMLQC